MFDAMKRASLTLSVLSRPGPARGADPAGDTPTTFERADRTLVRFRVR